VAGEDPAPARPERDHLERLRGPPGTSIPGEPIGMPATARPLTPSGRVASTPLHVGDRHMPLEHQAIDDGGVQEERSAGTTQLPLDARPGGIVDHAHLAPELAPHLVGPLLAAAAARIAVHGDTRCPRRTG
jgi:hypothetical protein